MKLFLPILILFSINVIAQETSIKPDSLKANQPDNKIYLASYSYGKQYKYQQQIIGDLAMKNVLLATHDKDIIAKVKSIKRYQALQAIGLLAIPFAVATVAYYKKSNEYVSSNGSPGIRPSSGYYTTNAGDLRTAEVCLVLTVACPVTGLVFRHKRIKLTKQAVQLYNERY